MLSRALLTASSLTVAAAATLLLDCSSASVEILGGDPLGVCAHAASLGLTDDVRVSIGLLTVAILSLALIWIPPLRPGEKRRRRSPARTLQRNLGRLPEVGDDARAGGEPQTAGFDLVGLRRRLEAVEASLGSEMASREAAEKWMDLLREANALHNSGDISTEDFKEINTRLVNLSTEPGKVVGV